VMFCMLVLLVFFLSGQADGGLLSVFIWL